MTVNDSEAAVRVDVGGYFLVADLVSGGSPPVVFISGRGDGRGVWAPVLSRLRSDSAALTYDRAGIGDSGKVPAGNARRYSDLAGELVRLLQGVSLDSPFVVVAHSMGVLVARSLAASHPHLIAGLVLLDGSVDELDLWPADRPPTDGSSPNATLLDFQGGATELANGANPAVPAVVVTRTPGRWPDPRGTAEVDQRWTRHQTAMAGRLNAPLLVANDSGHYVHHEAADLAALAVDEVIRAVLAGQKTVRLDSSQVASANGRRVSDDPPATTP